MVSPAQLLRYILRTRRHRLTATIAEAAPGTSSRGVEIQLSQRELGNFVGATRESVNKQLRAWAKLKWITLERGGVSVLAPEELGEIAKGGEKSAEKNADKTAEKK